MAQAAQPTIINPKQFTEPAPKELEYIELSNEKYDVKIKNINIKNYYGVEFYTEEKDYYSGTVEFGEISLQDAIKLFNNIEYRDNGCECFIKLNVDDKYNKYGELEIKLIGVTHTITEKSIRRLSEIMGEFYTQHKSLIKKYNLMAQKNNEELATIDMKKVSIWNEILYERVSYFTHHA